MPREIAWRFVCDECGKMYCTEALAAECESTHPLAEDGIIVSTEGYRRLPGSTPREVTIKWFEEGLPVKYRRVKSTVDVTEE